MTTFRTHFAFRVDTWTPDGESIVEHVASVEDYQFALATYQAPPANDGLALGNRSSDHVRFRANRTLSRHRTMTGSDPQQT
jgi:hypothetical protein